SERAAAHADILGRTAGGGADQYAEAGDGIACQGDVAGAAGGDGVGGAEDARAITAAEVVGADVGGARALRPQAAAAMQDEGVATASGAVLPGGDADVAAAGIDGAGGDVHCVGAGAGGKGGGGGAADGHVAAIGVDQAAAADRHAGTVADVGAG